MQITVTSSGITAAVAVIGLLVALLAFYIDATISKYFKRLNGTFLRSEGVHVTGREIDGRLKELETTQDRLDQCCHEKCIHLAKVGGPG